MKIRNYSITLPLLLTLVFSSMSPAKAADVWSFSEDSVSLSIGGKDCVDPFAESTVSGDRIYAPCAADVPAALSVYDCSESGSCTKATLRSRMGKSFTKVKLTSGQYRAYYVIQDFNNCVNTVETGILSNDGLEVSGTTSTGI